MYLYIFVPVLTNSIAEHPLINGDKEILVSSNEKRLIQIPIK